MEKITYFLQKKYMYIKCSVNIKVKKNKNEYK